jgi:hypothetical protein
MESVVRRERDGELALGWAAQGVTDACVYGGEGRGLCVFGSAKAARISQCPDLCVRAPLPASVAICSQKTEDAVYPRLLRVSQEA